MTLAFTTEPLRFHMELAATGIIDTRCCQSAIIKKVMQILITKFSSLVFRDFGVVTELNLSKGLFNEWLSRVYVT